MYPSVEFIRDFEFGAILMQGPGGIRAETAAPSGGTITVNVGPNDQSIQVHDPTTGRTTSHKVAPGKDTLVPMPVAPAGTVVQVRVGRGPNARIILVEIVSTNP